MNRAAAEVIARGLGIKEPSALNLIGKLADCKLEKFEPVSPVCDTAVIEYRVLVDGLYMRISLSGLAAEKLFPSPLIP